MQVMDIDAESPNSGKVTASSKVKKLERTVRYSSVLIVALGISLISLAGYTAVLVLAEYRSPQPCVSEQCVGTDFEVVDARNTSEVNKKNIIVNKNTTLIEDTDFEVVDARNTSEVNKENTIVNKNTTLIEDTDFEVVDARNTSEVNKENTIINKNTVLIEDTDFEVVDARNTSEVNKENTIVNKNTTLIEDTDFEVVDARNTSEVNKENTIVNKNTTLIEDTDFGVVDARNASTVNKDNTKKKTKLIEDTAARILQNLNRDVDPCTDFYEFACGGWIKQNPIPYWTTSWNQFKKLKVQVSSELRELLEAADDDGLPNSVIKAKSLYRTCMNTERADRIKTIQKVLQMLGLPPRPPTEMSANFSWEEVAGRSRRQLKLDLLLQVFVVPDYKNTSRNRVQIKQVSPWPKNVISFSYIDYYKFIRNKISEADNKINATQFAYDILKFSIQLDKITTPESPNDIGSPVDLSVQQLTEGPTDGPPQWKLHKWGRYLELVFSNTSVTLQDRDNVSVWDLPYLQKLSVLLANTEPVIIESYLWWRVFAKTLSVFDSLYFEYTSHWIPCTDGVNDHFDHALSYLYGKRHFENTSTQKAIEMLENIRSAFAADVQELDWMDSTTRLKTLNKLKAIKNLVGFPAWLLTPEQLDKFYSDAEVVEGNKFETYLKLTFAEVKRSLESVREKPDRNSWPISATEISAFYHFIFNSVTIPAAILQPPFYGNGIEAINYGSIGAVLGHEVTHGFDNRGRQHDEKGNLKDWWSNSTLEHYRSRVQCLIDQYNKYQISNYTVNGVKTQGENIADNGGLRAAWHAFQFTKRAPADSRVSLPGLTGYKPDQLFFLGFAQIWCANSTKPALETQIKKHVHSPHKIRVKGTLSNSKEFADAWSCPAGSPMNPEHKCVLW